MPSPRSIGRPSRPPDGCTTAPIPAPRTRPSRAAARRTSPASGISPLSREASTRARPTSSTRGRLSIHREAKRSSTWGSRGRQPHCWPDVGGLAPRRRSSRSSSTMTRGCGTTDRPRFHAGALETCSFRTRRRATPSASSSNDGSRRRPMRRAGAPGRDTSTTSQASRRIRTLRARSTRRTFLRTCQARTPARSLTSASARRR